MARLLKSDRFLRIPAVVVLLATLVYGIQCSSQRDVLPGHIAHRDEQAIAMSAKENKLTTGAIWPLIKLWSHPLSIAAYDIVITTHDEFCTIFDLLKPKDREEKTLRILC